MLGIIWGISIGSEEAISETVKIKPITEAKLHVSSSNTGADALTGIDVNAFLGANRFYDAGFTGSRTLMANIEAGHAWDGHETLGHVTTRVTGTGALGSTDNHATWVTHALAGRAPAGGGPYPVDYHAFGVGYGAETWSGAVADTLTAFTFTTTEAAVASTYATILETGISGDTANVFNSSWGFSEPLGFNPMTIGVDGLINRNGTVAVFSAGNEGSAPNSVGGIGAGYNSITVGALGSDTDGTPFNAPSTFSSRGPNDAAFALDPTTAGVVAGIRAVVDIAAPGQNLTLAQYDAAVPDPNAYDANMAGTSFAAPLVAGGAALVVDAGKALFDTNPAAVDGRVVKAVLLNGADKTAGWDNGQTVDPGAGSFVTEQSLDHATGAGRMNLDTTFDQYASVADGGAATTTDVPGLGKGDLGMVGTVGWDFGEVNLGESNFYFIDKLLATDTDFTATLTWFVDRDPGDLADFSGAQEEHFADLDLWVFEYDNPTDRNILGVTAMSISWLNVVEHLFFDVPSTGYYGLFVDFFGVNWNFTGESSEFYALAWSATAVPEPSSLLLVAAGMILLTGFARRRRNAASARN